MRCMMVMIPSLCQSDALPGERAEAGDAPPAEAGARMMTFNEGLVQAGALIALDGLHPRLRGARVACSAAHYDRWALHRGARSERRLLDDPGELDGSSGRMGQAEPRLGRRWHRGARGVRDEGLPCRRPDGRRQPYGTRADRHASRRVTPHLRST
jgi:hypothetical protein